jgi:hypothetical protein
MRLGAAKAEVNGVVYHNGIVFFKLISSLFGVTIKWL